MKKAILSFALILTLMSPTIAKHTSAPTTSVFGGDSDPTPPPVLSTGDSLEEFRLLMMFKKDQTLPFTPDNVTQAIWRFVSSDDTVTLPMPHMAFSGVIYRASFDDDTHDLDTIATSGEMMFSIDGESLEPNTHTITLTVTKTIVAAS
jgi:FtsP/CotA-like multicopper oxidase with cupredoxin domain